MTQVTSLDQAFESYGITPPTTKHEDWRYYDINDCLTVDFAEDGIKHGINITDPYYVHYLNGEIVGDQLPDGCTLTKRDIHPPKTDNGFINLAVKSSQGNGLTCKNLKDTTITIYYSVDVGVAHAALEVDCVDCSNVSIKRVFYVAKGAVLNTYTLLQVSEASSVSMFDHNTKNLGRILDFVDANVQANSLYLGLNQSYFSQNSRFQQRVFIKGEQALVRLHGLGVQEPKQQLFYNTHIHHLVGETESHQLFKSLNKDKSTFEYNGKVTVARDAQKINSYQLNQNIILDDTAHVYSRPQLFIDADDVKCTHGSTTGDLNEEEIFYLRSRGLDELSSRKLALKGFINDVFNQSNFEPNGDMVPCLDKVL
jgi:hypothetical protein